MFKIVALIFVFSGFILPVHSVELDKYERIYHKQCATCHGDKGDGRGRAGASLTPQPTSFISDESRARLSNDQIRLAIQNGIEGTSMSAYGRRFDESALSGMTNYIRQAFITPGASSEVRKKESEGELLYADHCSACHGDKGSAAVWAGSALKPPPRDFTSALSKRELTRERMLASVTYGRVGTAMMSFEKRLTSNQIQQVVAYIRGDLMKITPLAEHVPTMRGIKKAAPFDNGLIGRVNAGQAIFEKSCFACHGKKGDGKGPRSHFITPRPRDFTSKQSHKTLNRPALYRGIALGKIKTVMPAWSAVLTEQEIADVAEYVFQSFVQEKAKKKELNNADVFQRGRDIYNYRCYFCHGYSGDAKTLASSYLTPPPVAFTERALEELSYSTMLTAVREGKKDTAMMSFSGLLSSDERHAVVTFVRQAFMPKNAARKIKNTVYHTKENGWDNHQKYQLAYPFALGTIALDTSWDDLTLAQRQGKRLYLSACVICHDRAKVNDEGVIWQSRPISWPRNAYSHKAPTPGLEAASLDATSQASPYRVHDEVPDYTPKTEEEKKGQRLFLDNCAFCHAADGTGKNWIGQFLEPPARNFTSQSIRAVFTKGALKQRVENGMNGSAMPAWKYVLNEQEIDSIIAFMWNRFQ